MLAKLKSNALAATRWKRPIHTFALGGAWFFILFSLASLAWVTMAKLGDPSGSISLYQAAESGRIHHAFALSYDGVFGLFQVLGQLAVVSTAVAWTLSSKPARRRIAHGVLIAWAALWMFNLIHLAGIEPRFDSVCQAPLMMVLFACTTYRAARGWRQRPALQIQPECPQEPAPPVSDDLDALTSEDVCSGPAVSEITSQVAGGSPSDSRAKRRLKAAGRCFKPVAAGAGRIAKGTPPFIFRSAKRAGPIASAAGRKASGIYARARRYLKDKAVLPGASNSTAA